MTAREVESHMDWLENVPERYQSCPFVLELRDAVMSRLQAIMGDREPTGPSVN
jgi:hypothetical protein